MALKVSKRWSQPVPFGDRWMNVVDIAFDNSYTTGGLSLKPADLGFSPATDDEFHVVAIAKGGYVFHYDHTNQKVIAYQDDDDAAADAPLIEVANGTDLSAVTAVRVQAIGRYRG